MDDQFALQCEEKDTLTDLLKALKDHIVNVVSTGGWLFTGKLIEIEDAEIVLCDVTVTSTGGLTLCTFEVYRVKICLNEITSVGKPSQIPW